MQFAGRKCIEIDPAYLRRAIRREIRRACACDFGGPKVVNWCLLSYFTSSIPRRKACNSPAEPLCLKYSSAVARKKFHVVASCGIERNSTFGTLAPRRCPAHTTMDRLPLDVMVHLLSFLNKDSKKAMHSLSPRLAEAPNGWMPLLVSRWRHQSVVERCDGLVCVALHFVLQSGAFRWADAARYTVRKAAPPAAAPFCQSAQKFSCLNHLDLRFESEETRADVAGTVQLLPQQA